MGDKTLKGIGLLTVIALSSAACHTMKPVTLQQLEAIRPTSVQVTLADESVVVVSGPQTFGDTLVGYVNGRFEEMPSDEFEELLVRRPARGKTIALVAAGLAGIAATAALVSSSGDYRNPERLLDCDDDPHQEGCPLGP
jgi:hypothetical protein